VRPSAIVAVLAFLATTVSGLVVAPPASAVVICPTVDPNDGAVSIAPTPGIDWSGCNLVGADLTGTNISNANFAGADLRSARFDQSILNGANFSHANLTDASFPDTILNGANLSNAIARNIYLVAADLISANLSNADLSGGNIIYADFSSANLDGASLVNALLDPADFTNASLIGTNLSGARLNGAVFLGANLTNANLSTTFIASAGLATAFVTCSVSGSLGSLITGVPTGGLPSGWSLVGGVLSVPISTCAIPSAPDLTMWMQSTTRESESAACPDGYTGSWAMWPNAGTGGYVCNRFVRAYGS
jgi:uncharacterized protein YjbI with pentapeptide repeats